MKSFYGFIVTTTLQYWVMFSGMRALIYYQQKGKEKKAQERNRTFSKWLMRFESIIGAILTKKTSNFRHTNNELVYEAQQIFSSVYAADFLVINGTVLDSGINESSKQNIRFVVN